MLPKEIGELQSAISSPTDRTFDAARLGAELSDLSKFHEALIAEDLLTPRQTTLYQQYVGKWLPGGVGQVGLTAPPEGPPDVWMRTPDAAGTGTSQASMGSIKCPHCGKTIILKT